MPAAKVSLPITNPKFVYRLSTGAAAVGYKVQSYLAGTTTPSPTYTTPDNGVANANPVVLDANGEAVIWPGLLALDLQLQDASGVPLYTFQNWTPVAAVGSFSEWVQDSHVPTYVNATSFTVVGDLRSTYEIGRRLKSAVTAGTAYSTIVASTYSAPNTTVTLINDSTTLDSGLSAVSYSLLDSANRSSPQGTLVNAVVAAGTALVNNTRLNMYATNTTVNTDRLGEFVSGVFTAKVAGDYLLTANSSMVVTGVTFGTNSAQVRIFKNGSATLNFRDIIFCAGLGSPSQATAPSCGIITLAAGDQLTIGMQANFSVGTPTVGDSSLSIARIR